MEDIKNINFDKPFCVADWQVVPANNQLLRNDQTIKLEPKVMDVLVYLAQNQGEVISREQLEENVWTGRIVTYDALTATIVKLRKALDDNDKQAPLIKTIPKRGYCLMADVTAMNAKPEPALASSDADIQNQVLVENTKRKTQSFGHERRQVSILSCEIFSTHQDTLNDPEETHELFNKFQKYCTQPIKQYGGYITHSSNGQLIIYFGYPVAQEGDTERAIRTAFGILESVRHIRTEDENLQAALRIGIDSGLVIIGEAENSGHGGQISVSGDTPAVASMLKNHATENSIYISESTKNLAGNAFTYHLLTPIKLNENKEITTYQVESNQSSNTRFKIKTGEGISPMVGREVEVSLLEKRWEQSKAGESQVICLCAEAGIGKSRMLQAFEEVLGDEKHHRVLLSCSPYHKNSSLYPVIDYLTQTLKIDNREDPAKHLQHLEDFLTRYQMCETDVVPIFKDLLTFSATGKYPPLQLSADTLKIKTLKLLIQLFMRMSSNDPLLFILEDAHWIDPTTRELVELLIKELHAQPAMTITSYRPDFDPIWSGFMQTTLLRLNRLTRIESSSLIRHVAREQTLSNTLIDKILEKTDGVPLYIEELTRNLLLSGTNSTVSIPESLQDSLMARLDKLDHAKPVAQLASVLGRAFSKELLQAVSIDSEEQLDAALKELIDAELIYTRGIPPNVNFVFKHALVQDTAYESLLKSTRQTLHNKAADVLVQQFPQIKKAQPELLAFHYTRAKRIEPAIEYWLQAGQRANEHSANLEAIAHLNTGLDLLKQLPKDKKHKQLELQLLVTLGPPLLSAKGLGSQEAEQVYLRAQSLCRETDAADELFTVTWGLWMLCQKRGRMQEASEYAKELIELANQIGNKDYQLQAHHSAWTTGFRTSDFESCSRHVNEGLTIYKPEVHRHHAAIFGGHDPGVCAHYNNAMIQWLTGFPDSAVESAAQAVELANQINHPFSQVLAHVFSSFIAHCCGDHQAAAMHTRQIAELSQSHGIAPDCAAQARVIGGWQKMQTGEQANGINDIEQGIITLRNTGVRTHQLLLLSILADSYARIDQIDDGLRTIEDAMTCINETGEHTFESEIYRLKGKLLLIQSHENEKVAIEAIMHAWELANSQKAASLELRALLTLCQFLSGKKQDQYLRGVLEPLYHQFTQGHDTADLRTAATLLSR